MDATAIVEFSRSLLAECREEVTAYLIGGSALVAAAVQEETRDVDLVVSTGEERDALVGAAEALDFVLLGEEEERLDRPVQLTDRSISLDIFVVRTTHFCLSEGMRRRARPVAQVGPSRFSTLVPVDILLMKTATGRPGDSRRIRQIFGQVSVDWAAFLDEVTAQEEMGNYRAAFDVLDAFHEADVLRKTPREFRDALLARVDARLSAFGSGEP